MASPVTWLGGKAKAGARLDNCGIRFELQGRPGSFASYGSRAAWCHREPPCCVPL